MKSPAKKGLLLAGGLLGVALLLALALGLSAYSQAKRTLGQIAEPSQPKRELCVFVRAEDPAQSLPEAAGYRFGQVGEGEPLALARLEEALGQAPDPEEYPTVFALADALKEGVCQAVLLEEAWKASLEDARGYDWTREGMRKLGALELPAKEETLQAGSGEAGSRFLVYLGGSDTFGDIATLARSDVNILAAVDVPGKALALVATPRDFLVTFSRTGGAGDKLAHTGIYGVGASVEALEGLYGVEVDYTLRVNFTGFVEIIDALGGVSVYSDRAFTVEPIKSYQKGYNHLTGIEALAFARERMSFPEGDFQRAKNQMEVIRAVVEKAASPALLWNLAAVLQAVEGNVETNIPQEKLLSLAPALSGDWQVSTYTAFGESAYRETWSMPGQELYVLLPDEASVQEGAGLLRETLKGQPGLVKGD